jgi:RNA polymerase sigma-70 factor (ECF subfamily)
VTLSRRPRWRVLDIVEREIELRLVARLKTGDAAAFEAVYEAFRPRLFSFLARLSRRRDVAEDLLEETWLRLVTRAPELSDDTRLGPWLYTVARNLFSSWCRHRAVDESRLSDLALSWPGALPRESPFESAARGERERRLEAALARLTSADREVLLLVAAEELSPSEAAAVLGLTPEALRKRLQRARERLALLMEEEPELLREKAG